jgi:ElaB/YqjD/DUF883 family membrane-anchored ribosome-binding protein
METSYEELEKARSALARERVSADLKTLIRDSEELLRATAGDMTEKVKEARGRLGEALQGAKETCAQLQGHTMAAARQVDAAVRKHPYESIGIALGIGFLIGSWLKRRCD